MAALLRFSGQQLTRVVKLHAIHVVPQKASSSVSPNRPLVDLDVDLYNAFNSDAILSQQDNYGVAWQNATSVIQPRFAKFQVRWDF